jgi:hypothetical protein
MADNLLYEQDRRQLLFTASVLAFVRAAGSCINAALCLCGECENGRNRALPLAGSGQRLDRPCLYHSPYPRWSGPDGRQNNCYPSFGPMYTSDGGLIRAIRQPEHPLRRPSIPARLDLRIIHSIDLSPKHDEQNLSQKSVRAGAPNLADLEVLKATRRGEKGAVMTERGLLLVIGFRPPDL